MCRNLFQGEQSYQLTKDRSIPISLSYYSAFNLVHSSSVIQHHRVSSHLRNLKRVLTLDWLKNLWSFTFNLSTASPYRQSKLFRSWKDESNSVQRFSHGCLAVLMGIPLLNPCAPCYIICLMILVKHRKQAPSETAFDVLCLMCGSQREKTALQCGCLVLSIRSEKGRLAWRQWCPRTSVTSLINPEPIAWIFPLTCF